MVKRYLPVAGPVLSEGPQTAYAIECATGPYVLYSDYERMREALTAISDNAGMPCSWYRAVADEALGNTGNSAAPIPDGSDTGSAAVSIPEGK